MNELIPQVQCEWGRPGFFEKTVLDIMGKTFLCKPGLDALSALGILGTQWNNWSSF